MKASSRSADSSDLLNHEVIGSTLQNNGDTGADGVPVDYGVQVKFSVAT
jgi:hypothetical protein